MDIKRSRIIIVLAEITTLASIKRKINKASQLVRLYRVGARQGPRVEATDGVLSFAWSALRRVESGRDESGRLGTVYAYLGALLPKKVEKAQQIVILELKMSKSVI